MKNTYKNKMFFILKILLSALVIAGASWLSSSTNTSCHFFNFKSKKYKTKPTTTAINML